MFFCIDIKKNLHILRCVLEERFFKDHLNTVTITTKNIVNNTTTNSEAIDTYVHLGVENLLNKKHFTAE